MMRVVKAAHRGCWCPVPENFQGQAGQDFEQPDRVQNSRGHCSEAGVDDLQRSLPSQTILRFYDAMKTQLALKYRTLPLTLFPHIITNSCDTQDLLNLLILYSVSLETCLLTFFKFLLFNPAEGQEEDYCLYKTERFYITFCRGHE